MVAYWRFSIGGGEYHVSTIAAKSQVASIKKSTIPRLELQAAQLAARLAFTLKSEHDYTMTRRVFWSDSTTVLHWIRRDPKEFKAYVANRLKKIREKSSVSEWRYVLTKENPADDATRFAAGCLSEKSRWFQGPPFLRKNESGWLDQRVLQNRLREDCSELQPKVFCMNVVQDSLINFSRFSRWLRVICSTARFLEAVERMRRRKYSMTDLRIKAENVCMKVSQQSSFPEV